MKQVIPLLLVSALLVACSKQETKPVVNDSLDRYDHVLYDVVKQSLPWESKWKYHKPGTYPVAR